MAFSFAYFLKEGVRMKKTIEKHYLFDEVIDKMAKQKSKELNLSEAEYIRTLVLSNSQIGEYIALNEELRKMSRELSYIGNNINQIAHIANMMMLSKADINVVDTFRKEIFDFRIMLQDLLCKLKDGGDYGNNKNGIYKG